jgi:hypothetical protein
LTSKSHAHSKINSTYIGRTLKKQQDNNWNAQTLLDTPQPLKAAVLRHYAFVEYSNGELVVAAEDGRSIRFKPDELGCYVIHVNRTELGLAKERL